ncbi:hypothetical protein D3C87_1614950 [compost metagenome]
MIGRVVERAFQTRREARHFKAKLFAGDAVSGDKRAGWLLVETVAIPKVKVLIARVEPYRAVGSIYRIHELTDPP